MKLFKNKEGREGRERERERKPEYQRGINKLSPAMNAECRNDQHPSHCGTYKQPRLLLCLNKMP